LQKKGVLFELEYLRPYYCRTSCSTKIFPLLNGQTRSAPEINHTPAFTLNSSKQKDTSLQHKRFFHYYCQEGKKSFDAINFYRPFLGLQSYNPSKTFCSLYYYMIVQYL